MPSTDDESRGSGPRQTSQTGRRKRMRVFTSDDRASHRVVEKQRREALNTQFIELARLLPGLATTRRLSKSLIVSESIVHQKKQRDQRLACAQQIRAMGAAQASLVAEVNSLRAQLGITDRREDAPLSAEALEMLEVEEEVFGTFPAGFGDNGEDANDGDDDMGIDVDEERHASGSVRRSRRSASRSMSNASASPRTLSRSSARSAGSTAGKTAAHVPASRSPPAPSAPSPVLSTSEADPSDAGETSPVLPAPYDADFLAMFSTPPSSIPTAQISFGFSPVSENAPFANQLPLGSLSQSEHLMGYMHGTECAFSSGGDSQLPAVDEMWRFLQPHPGAGLSGSDTGFAGLSDTGLMGGFPVAAPAPYHMTFAFPSVHVGTHGGFAV